MPKPGRLPESLSASGFTVGEARQQGMSRRRMRASDLRSPFHGVRTGHETPDARSRALAYASKMPPNHFFSHTTAAQLLGLRMPGNFHETVLHVTALSPARAPRCAGVIGHGMHEATIALVDGLPVLSPIDTWCQLSATLSLDDLVVMGDGLVRRKRPIATMEQLQDAVSRFSGRGCRQLREALHAARAGTDSARESLLRLMVMRAGFPEPEVNGIVLNEYGAQIAHGDLVFRRYRTILEYEGRQHSEDPRQFAIDIARLDAVMEQRWRVIRVDRELMSRRASLLGKIDRALRDGGWTPTSRSVSSSR